MTGPHSKAVTVMRVALFLFVLGGAEPVAAQAASAPRVWTAISVRGPVSTGSPWRWAFDSLVRTRDGVGDMDFAAGLVSLSRDLTGRSAVAVGYAYGAGFPDGGSLREHRFVQQYTWRAGRAWQVSLRSRVEERVIDGREGVAMRLRQQVRASWPLSRNGALRGIVSEEVFVTANRTSWAPRGFDASRTFAGIGWKMTPRSGVEVGYIHVYSPRGSNGASHSHVLSATLVVTR